MNSLRLFLWGQHHCNSKTREWYSEEREPYTHTPDENRCKNPLQNDSYTIQSHIRGKKSFTGLVGFTLCRLECFNEWKSIHVIHHINKLKIKTPEIIPIAAMKALCKMWHSCLTISCQEPWGNWVRGAFLNTIKVICDKPTASLILHGRSVT